MTDIAHPDSPSHGDATSLSVQSGVAQSHGRTATAAPAPGSTDSVAMLAHIVSYDTTSDRSDLPLIDWISGWMDAHGVSWSLSHDPSGEKANLHAIIGPREAGGLAFAGHVDTVPVTGQEWTGDPFVLREQGGKLIGRGAADMKGYVACMLAAVPDLVRIKLERPVHLLFTFDEEISCDGARVAMQDALENNLLPSVCVVGEPTLMTPVIAHKGRLAARLVARGKPGHSSRPAEGVNALHALGEAMAWVAAEARRLALEGRKVEGFEPPNSTIQIGFAQGGTAINIIPERAEALLEWRNVPGDDSHAMMARMEKELEATTGRWMREADPECGLSFEVLNELPPLALAADNPLTTAVKLATGANAEEFVSYGTEGGIYQQAGMTSIVCGPGSIEQAHRPDEWIARTQLERCDAFIRDMAQRVCTRSTGSA
ncbi:acetylornithine deacetylase [Acetobacter nitrogenifigens DSM 23921 = NBRC 105050]|uniref:Acetylornithine deacetylase n=1 Tax=Acetobacter nitrogenifigens DSM 23921 = NBRC 105050 TaxID=1120919 RepID=A0A511XC29_9PROT|nr:acetylornithine deacetylase [Acetobacter nitrogenifigens]GBQ88595.1 acetylornithine deacetylase [Acetobacter nitrogenifigens DSM 23921 = NBRC 105050]GEN60445.1 acetylornithine deacetylase [Acetobacter nitrogenifigens DSM 23921 = NBRC 105050]